MPRIAQYEAPKLGLSPSDRGTNAAANTGRRVGGFYNQNAGALDRVAAGTRQIGSETERLGRETAAEGAAFANDLGHGLKMVGEAGDTIMTHQQVATGAAHGAQIFDNLQQSMDQAIKSVDPKDPAYGQKVKGAIDQWREQNVEPALTQFKDGFTTERSQQWAESFIDRTRQHMFTSSSAEVSSAASVGVKNAIHQTINLGSKSVFDDPTRGTLNAQIDLLEHSVTGLVSTSPVKGTDAAKLSSEVLTAGKEAIIKSAAQGYIQKTGQMPPWLDDPAYAPYVNGAETKQFQQYAVGQQRANMLTQKGIENYNFLQETREAKAATSKAWTDNVSFDSSGKVTIKPNLYQDLMAIEEKRPGHNTEENKAMLNWGQSQQKERREAIITDPNVYGPLVTGITNIDKPTSRADILIAASKHQIDAHDTAIALQLEEAIRQQPIKAPNFHNAMDGVKAELGDSELGKVNYSKFFETLVPHIQQLEREGKLKPGDLSLKDPNSLLNKTLDDFRLTPNQKMMGAMLKRFGMGGDMAGVNPIQLLNPDAGTKALPPKPATADEYNKLKPGATYVAPDGSTRTKGGK